ncbi:hypothetical protein GQ457_16G003420 [Hibiscus cannabinus]
MAALPLKSTNFSGSYHQSMGKNCTMAHSHSTQNPVIEQRRVMITNKHGEKLVGLLHESESKEIVVLCHGFKSNKGDIILVNLAAALEKEGISVFRFDFAGQGVISVHGSADKLNPVVDALAFAEVILIEQRRVMITNKHGEKLVGLLHESESKEIVVLCHGFKSNKGDIVLVNLAAALEKEGISVFRFDFTGDGESEGSSLFADFDRETDDIRAVVQHFSGKNRVVSAILGHSKGACLVLLYASKYHDVRVIVNVSGRYNLKRGLTEDFVEKIQKDGYIEIKNKKGSVGYRVTEKDLMNLLTTDMREVCRKISKECRVMVLTIHGSTDKMNPVNDALEFA